jgi:hypothetical protein
MICISKKFINNQGLSNLAPGNEKDYNIKSNYFGIRIGCILIGKKISFLLPAS